MLSCVLFVKKIGVLIEKFEKNEGAVVTSSALEGLVLGTEVRPSVF